MHAGSFHARSRPCSCLPARSPAHLQGGLRERAAGRGRRAAACMRACRPCSLRRCQRLLRNAGQGREARKSGRVCRSPALNAFPKGPAAGATRGSPLTPTCPAGTSASVRLHLRHVARWAGSCWAAPKAPSTHGRSPCCTRWAGTTCRWAGTASRAWAARRRRAACRGRRLLPCSALDTSSAWR